MKNKARLLLLSLGSFALVSAARAQTTPSVDLTAVTDGITDLKSAALTAAGVVIAAGIGLMAVKFGGRWVVKVFKSFSG